MHPVSVFFYFESTLKTVEEDRKYQKHIVNSVGYKFNCIHLEHSEPLKIIQSSNSDEVISQFIEELERLAHKSFELTKINNYYNKDTTEAKAELKTHYKVKICQDCNCNFTEDNKKVLHHDHISGRYISSLCSKCNLNYTYQRFLPVYAHNLKGYDGHFIVPALEREGEIGEVQCIPNNEEKYKAFTKRLTIDYENKEKIINYLLIYVL
jgi:RNase P subunit RPR2